jgi:hypothetical protein
MKTGSNAFRTHTQNFRNWVLDDIHTFTYIYASPKLVWQKSKFLILDNMICVCVCAHMH